MRCDAAIFRFPSAGGTLTLRPDCTQRIGKRAAQVRMLCLWNIARGAFRAPRFRRSLKFRRNARALVRLDLIMTTYYHNCTVREGVFRRSMRAQPPVPGRVKQELREHSWSTHSPWRKDGFSRVEGCSAPMRGSEAQWWIDEPCG